MPLITCPECNNSVSSYAKVCPNCGYPISEHILNQPKYDVVFEDMPRTSSIKTNCLVYVIHIVLKLDVNSNIAKDVILKSINTPFKILENITIENAEYIKAKLKALGADTQIIRFDGNSTIFEGVDCDSLINKVRGGDKNILTCPRCGSTAITTGSRGYSLVWGFAGSNKTVNRCGKCGYSWKP